MESTKVFNKLSYELKNKIYKKYSFNLDEILKVIKPAILSIYGKQYSALITQKFKQLHLINFFEKSDLYTHFYSHMDEFRPVVLESKKDNSEEENDELPDLSELDLLFGSDTFKIEKIYDQDVLDYNDIASEYSSNLYNDYFPGYNITPISDEMYNKKSQEYELNASMYSCAKEELSKLNLILDSDFIYNNLKDILFLNNSALIHNVNNKLEKSDILIINPIKFRESDVFHLICNIITSINTDLIVDENQVFTFNRGLTDTFIKHNFNYGIEYENRDCKYLIDFINQSLAFEVINYLQNNNLSIVDYDTFPTFSPYPSNSSSYHAFYSHYKRLILDSIITKDTTELFNKIGKDNFIKFVNVSFRYIEDSRNAYVSSTEISIDTNNYLSSLYTERDKLIKDMINYEKDNNT